MTGSLRSTPLRSGSWFGTPLMTALPNTADVMIGVPTGACNTIVTTPSAHPKTRFDTVETGNLGRISKSERMQIIVYGLGNKGKRRGIWYLGSRCTCLDAGDHGHAVLLPCGGDGAIAAACVAAGLWRILRTGIARHDVRHRWERSGADRQWHLGGDREV